MSTSDLHTSFMRHANWRYLKLALVIGVASLVVYVIDSPAPGRSGNSWAGYGLGGLGAFLILWLAWLGVRKRSYAHGSGTMTGWVSAHVYLGLALIIVATLHTGFQFGLNVHTFAYVLMCLVILSGVIGVFCYRSYPRRITRLRNQRSRDEMIDELHEIGDRVIEVADAIDPEAHRDVVASTHRVRIGGSLWQQLRGYDAKRNRRLTARMRDRLVSSSGNQEAEDPSLTNTRMFMASRIPEQSDAGRAEKLRQLVDLLTRRDELCAVINRDIAYNARMRGWLVLHIPLTVALLAALTAHVVSVFVYW